MSGKCFGRINEIFVVTMTFAFIVSGILIFSTSIYLSSASTVYRVFEESSKAVGVYTVLANRLIHHGLSSGKLLLGFFFIFIFFLTSFFYLSYIFKYLK